MIRKKEKKVGTLQRTGPYHVLSFQSFTHPQWNIRPRHTGGGIPVRCDTYFSKIVAADI